MGSLIEHDAQLLLQGLWERSGGENLLGRYESFQAAFEGRAIPEVTGHNSGNHKPVVVCIDEGITPWDIGALFDHHDADIVRVAGSGILANGSRAFRDVMGLTAHERCGAAGIYASQNELLGDADAHGLLRGIQIADAAGVEHFGMVKPHQRPLSVHDARVIYYDGTKKGWDASRIDTLPKGFGVSRGFFGSEIGQHDAALAKQIALGNHGLGDRFTAASPLYLVAVSDGNRQSVPVKQLMAELEGIRGGARNIRVVSLDVSSTKGGPVPPQKRRIIG